MPTAVKLALLGIVIVLAALAANWRHDVAYRVNALVVMVAAAAAFLWTMGREQGAPMPNGHPAGDPICGRPVSWDGIALCRRFCRGFAAGQPVIVVRRPRRRETPDSLPTGSMQ